MAFKSATGKMFTLFKACLPENEFIQKRLLVEELLESKDYRELKIYTPAQTVFEKYYSKSALMSLDISTLKNLPEILALDNELFPALVHAKNFRDVSSLSKDEQPCFTNLKSLQKVFTKIQNLRAIQNLTNITDDEAMVVFDSSIVTSLDDIIENVEFCDSNALDEGIKKILIGQKYCIPKDKISDCQNKIQKLIKEQDRTLDGFAKNRKKRLLKKLILIVIASGTLAFGALCMEFDLVDAGILASLASVIALLYLLLG